MEYSEDLLKELALTVLDADRYKHCEGRFDTAHIKLVIKKDAIYNKAEAPKIDDKTRALLLRSYSNVS